LSAGWYARRKFFEAQAERPAVVEFILRQIGRLYAKEREGDASGVSNAQRRDLRQRHFTRRLFWLRKVVLGLRERVLPKSGLGKACD